MGKTGLVRVAEVGICGPLLGPYKKCNAKARTCKDSSLSYYCPLHKPHMAGPLYQVPIIIQSDRGESVVKDYSIGTWFLTSQVRICYEFPQRELGVQS